MRKIVVPSGPNKQRDCACNTGSLPQHFMFEQENISAMNRLVESTMESLEMDE
jgi:hypothetical protein